MKAFTEQQKEKLLAGLLEGLRTLVFVESVNSVTGAKEELNPTVEDMEAVIRISGEFDREDLKNLLAEIKA